MHGLLLFGSSLTVLFPVAVAALVVSVEVPVRVARSRFLRLLRLLLVLVLLVAVVTQALAVVWLACVHAFVRVSAFPPLGWRWLFFSTSGYFFSTSGYFFSTMIYFFYTVIDFFYTASCWS